MAYRTVLIKSTNDNFIELEAASAVTPGEIVERTSAGKCQAHSTAGGDVGPVLVAMENYLEGEAVDTDYDSGDIVICKVAAPGERFALLLTDDSSAAGGIIVESEYVESDGAGRCRLHSTQDVSSGEAATIYSKPIIGMALEDKDMTDSSGADPNPRFAVEIV